LVTSYDLQPGNGVILVEKKGMDKRRKQLKPMRKGKSKKRAKDEEVNGKGGKTGVRKCPGPTWGKHI